MFLMYFNVNYTNPRFVIYNTNDHESVSLNSNIFVQYIFLTIFAIFFIIIYFSFFTNPFNEENFLDTDYLSASASVEAEKEISSFDDIILTLIILFYVFGWYFYIHC
jgi:predicted secreted protein